MEGLPHKFNLKLNLWLMPECLASRGCINEAGRDFSPGLKSHAIGFSRWVTKTLPGLQPLRQPAHPDTTCLLDVQFVTFSASTCSYLGFPRDRDHPVGSPGPVGKRD